MKGSNLGELEEIVLLVVVNLQDDAYGLAIKNYIIHQCGRKVSISTVHATLHRLEQKGFLNSKYGHTGDNNRGGRPKLLFSITKSGEASLKSIKELRNKLWNTAPIMSFE